MSLQLSHWIPVTKLQEYGETEQHQQNIELKIQSDQMVAFPAHPFLTVMGNLK